MTSVQTNASVNFGLRCNMENGRALTFPKKLKLESQPINVWNAGKAKHKEFPKCSYILLILINRGLLTVLTCMLIITPVFTNVRRIFNFTNIINHFCIVFLVLKARQLIYFTTDNFTSSFTTSNLKQLS